VRILIVVVLILLKGQLWAGWAEETLQKLTLEEKIGQLFIVPASPQFEKDLLFQTIEACHIGSVLMKQASTPAQHIALIEALQRSSKLPLLCAGDAEYGLAMRIKNTLAFPKNLALGAIQEKRLLCEFGKMVGEQCKLMGIHLNLAPVVDVNNSSSCPIMGMRSFGDDPKVASIQSILAIKGMQYAGILSCAKHFPGHGSAPVDSHKALPTISSPIEHLEKVDFVPFKRVIAEAHVAAIMSGHLVVPALDGENPASLSRSIITDLLKGKWGFKGLIITDALNMRALSANYTTEEIATGAFMAGNDLLLYGASGADDIRMILEEVVPCAFSAIKRGVIDGTIHEKELDARVLKILSIKEKLGLHHDHISKIDSERAIEQLHSKEAHILQQKLYRGATLIINNDRGIIPAKAPEYVKLWEGKRPSKDGKKRRTLVVGVNHISQLPELQEICNKHHRRVIAAIFLPPYLLQQIPPEVTTVVGYELCAESEKAVWDVITGTR